MKKFRSMQELLAYMAGIEIPNELKNATTKNMQIADKWKVFISKGNGGAGTLGDEKQVAILGKPYLGKVNFKSSTSDIDWSKSIADISEQLCNKYGFTAEEKELINNKIKPME